eukprot:GILK01006430.1.p1 GENE.GILK01006430.1~~GILK01006430.1.p1  ORF type:complete len:280 (-),score=52.49 GILK01006430.1:25-825(-)
MDLNDYHRGGVDIDNDGDYELPNIFGRASDSDSDVEDLIEARLSEFNSKNELEGSDENTKGPQLGFASSISDSLSIYILENKQKGIGFQLWPAAIAMCTFFDKLIAESSRELFVGKNMIELGAGTGLVGMYGAALGAQVTLTDLEAVLGNLEANVELNPVVKANGSIDVKALCWGEDQLKYTKGAYDYVLVADGIYWEFLFEPLLQTLIALASTDTVVYVAQLRRRKLENRFFRRAAKYFEVNSVFDLPMEGLKRSVNIYEFKALK